MILKRSNFLKAMMLLLAVMAVPCGVLAQSLPSAEPTLSNMTKVYTVDGGRNASAISGINHVTEVTDAPGAGGKNVLRCVNGAPQFLSANNAAYAGMSKLHIEYYTTGTCNLTFSGYSSEGWKDSGTESLSTTNSWQAIDIDIAAIENFNVGFITEFYLSNGNFTNNFTSDIYFTNIYFWGEPDTTAPTGLVVNGVTADETFALIKVQANDTPAASRLTYELYQTSNDTKVAETTGTQGTEATIRIEGLTANTTYTANTYYIRVKDSGNNYYDDTQAKVFVPEFTTLPPFVLTAAPTPPDRETDHVKSIYSDKYAAAVGTPTWQTWDSQVSFSDAEVNGDHIKKFSNCNYNNFGIEFDSSNFSDMDYLHIDFLPRGAMQTCQLSPVMASGAPTQTLVNLSDYVSGGIQANQWNSVNIPLSDFTNLDFAANNSAQIRFNMANNGEGFVVYVDNIYYWKSMASIESTANHNIGCKTDSDGPIASYDGVKAVLPAGNRVAYTQLLGENVKLVNWGYNGSVPTGAAEVAYDGSQQQILKFSSIGTGDEVWASGGLTFEPTIDASATGYMLHAAIYAETAGTNLQIRLSSPNDGNYNQYQVNTNNMRLEQGWNYLNLPVTVKNHDRKVPADDETTFAYWDCGGVFNFDVTDIRQVGFIIKEGGRSIYIDDLYFYTTEGIPVSPEPAANPAIVKNIYSEHYSPNMIDANLIANSWMNDYDSQTGRKATEEPFTHGIEGNQHYMQLNTVSEATLTWPAADFGTYSYLYADVYPEADGEVNFCIFLKSQQDPTGGDAAAINAMNKKLKGRTWNTIAVSLEDIKAAYGDSFNANSVISIAFVNGGGNSFALDNIYLTAPSSTDPDTKGINWDTSNGGSPCFVQEITLASPKAGVEDINGLASGYDHDNRTFLGIQRDETNPYYVVAKLSQSITVSDVEIVWGNGYPMHYDVYALTTDPVSGDDNVNTSLLTDDKKLFHVDNPTVSYEPFFNTTSELQGKGNQNGDSRYVVIKMWEPMGSTFGFKIHELHVGAYDSQYDVVDHIGTDDYTLRTEKYNAQRLTPTARNSRNAILSGHNVTAVNYSVAGDGGAYVNTENIAGVPSIWASKVGSYTLQVTGSVDGLPVPHTGSSAVNVYRDWLGINTNTRSMIQDLNDENFTANIWENWLDGYQVKYLKDESEDTRWSTGNYEESARNAYVVVKLNNGEANHSFQVKDMELVWERAYPQTYAVYAFNNETLNVSSLAGYQGGISVDDAHTKSVLNYDEFKTTYADNLIYETTLPNTITEFPYHDRHWSENTGFNLRDAKWLVLVIDEPVTQYNGVKYGASIWEMYAQATDVTALEKMQSIKAADHYMFLNDQAAFTVQAYDNAEGTGTPSIAKLTGATFANGSNTTVTIGADGKYTVKGTGDLADVVIATIWDAGNNTYAIQSGTDKRIVGNNGYTVTVKYTKGNQTEVTNTFGLRIFKKPMDLMVNSTEKALVFDDGYFDVDRLNYYANKNALYVDLRNVDFTTYNDGTPVTGGPGIPAPRQVNLNGGTAKYREYYINESHQLAYNEVAGTERTLEKMNPNAIYYVSQPAFNTADNYNKSGNSLMETGGAAAFFATENVAMPRVAGSTTYFLKDQRIFDGYDYNPTASEVTGLEVHKGFFYTNVAKDKKMTYIFPFEVRGNLLNDGLAIKEVGQLNINNETQLNTITLNGISEGSNPAADKVYVISATTADRYSRTGGYATAFYNRDYETKSEAGNTEYGHTPVKMTATAMQDVDIYVDGTLNTAKARLGGSFFKRDLPWQYDATYCSYLYTTVDDKFLPANDEWFSKGSNFGIYQDFEDRTNKLFPFYGYLLIPQTLGGSANAISFRFVDAVDDEATGIQHVSALRPGAVYTLDGRLLSTAADDATLRSLPSGIYIINGKKYVVK